MYESRDSRAAEADEDLFVVEASEGGDSNDGESGHDVARTRPRPEGAAAAAARASERWTAWTMMAGAAASGAGIALAGFGLQPNLGIALALTGPVLALVGLAQGQDRARRATHVLLASVLRRHAERTHAMVAENTHSVHDLHASIAHLSEERMRESLERSAQDQWLRDSIDGLERGLERLAEFERDAAASRAVLDEMHGRIEALEREFAASEERQSARDQALAATFREEASDLRATLQSGQSHATTELERLFEEHEAKLESADPLEDLRGTLVGHIVDETDRVLAAVDAVARGEWAERTTSTLNRVAEQLVGLQNEVRLRMDVDGDGSVSERLDALQTRFLESVAEVRTAVLGKLDRTVTLEDVERLESALESAGARSSEILERVDETAVRVAAQEVRVETADIERALDGVVEDVGEALFERLDALSITNQAERFDRIRESIRDSLRSHRATMDERIETLTSASEILDVGGCVLILQQEIAELRSAVERATAQVSDAEGGADAA